MITPVYKPVGPSTHQIAIQLAKLLGEKTTHTGSLDPMAEGVVVCLSGSDRFRKAEHTATKKTYLFEIIGGFSTDSHDLLGLIVNQISPLHLAKLSDLISDFLPEFIGEQHQILPAFSAKRISGKSYFDLAKENRDFKKASTDIEIFTFKQLKQSQIPAQDLLTEIEEKISQVTGDFRQLPILQNWQQLLKTDQSFPVITLEMTCSKRTYVRALVRDLSQKIGLPLVTKSIIRTQNGPYTIKDCLCLVQ